MTKRCMRCRVVKRVDEFNKNAANKDGFQDRCRLCHVAANRESRLAHPETHAERHRRYYEGHRSQIAARRADWRRLNREKYLAHKAVENAVLHGRLERPPTCSVCGTDKRRIEAHHHDYTLRLDVEWLCPPCHAIADLARKRQEEVLAA
jgi:hypothetical protein